MIIPTNGFFYPFFYRIGIGHRMCCAYGKTTDCLTEYDQFG